MNLLTIILEILTIILSLLAIVYSFGVIWRVEKKLDVAHKLFLASIISFTLSEIFSILDLGNQNLTEIISLILKTVFAILFLLAILEVRKMIRQMDKEIPGKIGEEE